MTEKRDKILIIDDEEAIRRLIRSKLSAEGYKCEEASSAAQALDRLRDGEFGLVFLDIKMPGKSGIELLPEIKALYPDTAVIMATAMTEVSTAITCMRQGAYDYITKPLNLEELVLSAGRALEKRHLELENRDYQQHLEQKVEVQARKIRASFLSAITALAYALEAKDKYTIGHSHRVSEISAAIAHELGVPPEEVEKVRLAGLTHDIGKIGVRESVLNKPAKLSDEEYQHVKSHPGMGEHILTPVMEEAGILEMVRHHHERYDGTGYPDRLANQQIPPGARLLAVSDCYDAMTSARSYRQALSAEAACAEIERCKGTQLDPQVAEAFLRIKAVAFAIKKATVKEVQGE